MGLLWIRNEVKHVKQVTQAHNLMDRKWNINVSVLCHDHHWLSTVVSNLCTIDFSVGGNLDTSEH